jgi:hypothetical protein
MDVFRSSANGGLESMCGRHVAWRMVRLSVEEEATALVIASSACECRGRALEILDPIASESR